MKVINSVFISVFASLIIGCGGSGSTENNDQKSTSKYAGIWYLSDLDEYLEIKNDDDVSIRVCSVNNGYKKSKMFSAYISNDKLVKKYLIAEDEYISQLSLSSDTNELYVGQDAPKTYERRNFLPPICINDAIDLTYYFPKNTVEGQLTDFVVNFDYKLVSSAAVKIHACVSTFLLFEINGIEEEIVACVTVDQSSISKPGTNSGSYAFKATPEIFVDGSPYYVSVALHDAENFKTLAYDSAVINVEDNRAFFESYEAPKNKKQALFNKVIRNSDMTFRVE